MRNNQAPPQIKKYSALLNYLQDYMIYRKSVDGRFSYDTWAAELGFKSHSFMSMICKGKRTITPEFVRIFSKSMSFTKEEQRHMSLLADYARAKTESQKKLFQEKITESQDVEESLYDIKDYVQFLSSPSALQLLLVISFEDIVATNKNLKNILQMTSVEFNKNIQTLEKLKLIEYHDKTWVPKSKSFKLEDRTRDKAFAEFHKKSLAEAKAMLDKQLDVRRFRSIYFSLANEEIDEMKNEIEVFLTKMKRKYSGRQFHNRRLIKLNLQAYPVSQLYRK